MNLSGKSAFYTVLAAGCLMFFTSCGKYNGRTPLPTTDQMSQNEWVYGDPQGPARQSLNSYPVNPESVGKAMDLRDMMYASDTASRGKKVATTMIKPAGSASQISPAAPAQQ